jgi:hypothetical protein
MNSRTKDQMINDSWHIGNTLHNFLLDYEEELNMLGHDLTEMRTTINKLDLINKEVGK